MARSDFALDYDLSGVTDMLDAVEAPGTVIDSVLKDYAGPLIDTNIRGILPVSGRTWRGKKAAASATAPFKQENKPLEVTVRTKTAYHYLYFPDDGSNTVRHAGGQNFMGRGLDNSVNDIVERCVGSLLEPAQGK